MASLGCSEGDGSKIKVAEPDHGDSGRYDNDTSLEQSSDKIKADELRCTAQTLIKRRELPNAVLQQACFYLCAEGC